MKTKFILLLCLISVPLYSQTRTFVREYTYTAGEADSKITSRAIALDQVKRILLEEIGVYLQSSFESTREEKNNVLTELTKEQIKSITAGVTETKILAEKWNGETYYIKASITVNTEDVSNNIARIASDQSKLKELEEATQRADSAYAEIGKLRKQLTAQKDENQRLETQKEYTIFSNVLSATDWIQKGYDAGEAKDFDNAILFYEKAIELDPYYSPVYGVLGVIYAQKGEFDKAITILEKAIELNPRYSAAYYSLGLLYQNIGEIDKAIPLYEKAVELNPRSAYAYNTLGFGYQGKGEIDKAIPFYEEAIELNPNDSTAYYNLGFAYHTKGEIDKAIPLYEKAIKLGPNYSVAYLGLGLANFDKGEIDKAIPFYERVIDLEPQNSMPYYFLGLAYGKKGDIEKKVGFYKKAAQLGDADAQSWLKQNGYGW